MDALKEEMVEEVEKVGRVVVWYLVEVKWWGMDIGEGDAGTEWFGVVWGSFWDGWEGKWMEDVDVTDVKFSLLWLAKEDEVFEGTKPTTRAKVLVFPSDVGSFSPEETVTGWGVKVDWENTRLVWDSGWEKGLKISVDESNWVFSPWREIGWVWWKLGIVFLGELVCFGVLLGPKEVWLALVWDLGSATIWNLEELNKDLW